jgi:PBP1b-binding outer membrane lipoprotein LpoB
MRVRLVVVALSALVLAGCSGSEQPASSAAEPGKVTELKSVDALRAAFAEGAGKPRLLLLLSPT